MKKLANIAVGWLMARAEFKEATEEKVCKFCCHQILIGRSLIQFAGAFQNILQRVRSCSLKRSDPLSTCPGFDNGLRSQ